VLEENSVRKGDLMMNQTQPVKSAIDPVCGMSVNPATTDITTVVEGQHYYFCAEGCRKAFMENPEKFLNAACDKPKGWWGRYLARLNKATGGKSMKCH
jgi:YHS domain-containing protein